ncbi:MAG: hypothetical protein [Bacteriophage sp.]|nr:MAG: hypothetical protein [Bacteriophage sp.]
MAKKAKKLINKVKKFTEKVDPFGAGLLNPYADGLSDQFLGTDNSGIKAATKAAEAEANARQESLMAAMNNTAQNANVDLSLANIPDTEIGGTATGLASSNTNKRKKQGPGGVAASLGINA